MRAKNQASNQQSPSSYTFTDLAQMVCKVSRGNQYDIDSDSDELEEYEADLEEDAQEVGYASEPTAGILDQASSIFHYSYYVNLSIRYSYIKILKRILIKILKTGRHIPHFFYFHLEKTAVYFSF